MTLEQSWGKLRPTLPRLDDIPVTPAACEPDRSRDGQGRFQAGNRIGIGRGHKALMRRWLNPGVGDDVARRVAKEALRLYLAVVRTLPDDGPAVRSVVAAQARHAALGAYFASEAAAKGLGTKEGMVLADQARQHDQIALRHAVAALDLATRAAASKRPEDPRERIARMAEEANKRRQAIEPAAEPIAAPATASAQESTP